ncbi:packaged DNA stabilization protein [Novosphingobium sp. M1R2S20]|uniref:Packaged DNA stabilization protein n=1 Tax=Novosphingobium rhizovicinum TaxID=3228928 RepID=A0ABV3RDL4_9SPHN
MQIPIMAGTTVKDGEFVASYPVNLQPRVIDSGVSKGQLVTAPGAQEIATGPGKDRGGIVWNDVHYRVMGSKLVSVSATGTVAALADVGDDGSPAGLDYGFGRLAIRSSQRLYYWNGSALSDVTDPDLGVVKDMLWIDGYYATTDGEYIIVTDLNDPLSVNPTRYGSAEEDPDAITGLLKYREELYALGRHTIQPFQNVGGNGFPFQTVTGGMIPVGCVSATAKCMVGGDGFAFVGSARGEPLSVWYYGGGAATRLSDDRIDDDLAVELHPEAIEMECRAFPGERQIIVHLAGKSWALSLSTTEAASKSAWFALQSGAFGPYRLRHAVLHGTRHIVGDTQSNRLGVLTGEKHFGEAADWRFDAALLFDPAGALVSEIELFGQFPLEPNAVFFSMTRDGVQWSREVSRALTGRRDERVIWRPNVELRTMGAFRWRGRGRVAIARCEAS